MAGRSYPSLNETIRDSFFKTLQDTDATDFTEFHGKNRKKKAPFRGFREIRVPRTLPQAIQL
jgi:hypothetical protein